MRRIDADALLKRWCAEVCKPNPNCNEDCTMYDYLTIESLSPTIEPERKNGNWIWKNKKVFCPGDCWYPPIGFEDTWNEKEGSWIEKELYCSECNYKNERHYKSNFCPRCGADMRGEQNG